MAFFGQDRKLGEVYDAVPDQDFDKYNEMIDALLKSGMDNDAIEDEIRNLESFGMLNDMRQDSTSGALGQVDTKTMNELLDALRMVDGPLPDDGMDGQGMKTLREMRERSATDRRKRLTPERIHNLGAMYGEPLSEIQIKYFEDQINRDPNKSYMGDFPEYPSSKQANR